MIPLIIGLGIIPSIAIALFALKKKKDGKETDARKITIAIITILVISASLILVVILLSNGEKDPVVHIQDGKIQIDAMYGLTINDADVKSITLIEKSMHDIDPAMHRDNGYAGFGQTLKGYFSSDTHGKFMLFVQSKTAPTIWIQSNSEDIYISLINPDETRTLYNELKTAALPEQTP